jgi:hypothetical protein
MNRMFSRRTILRGAGVALALPWLESLAPRSALAQNAVRKRYLPIYIPNGTIGLNSNFWTPTGQGQGAAWTLSAILEPLKAFKPKMSVITGLENGTAFNANRSGSVEPSHGRQPGAWLNCIDPAVVTARLGFEANQPTVDQLIGKTLKGQTPIDTLQIGLSTTTSFCDSQPCSNSRTISWSEKNLPMYKMVDPLELFNKLAMVATPGTPGVDPSLDPAVQKRIALNKSVLDAVIENTTATKTRLGKLDQMRLDNFLDSVREVEVKATMASSGMGGLACKLIDKPTMSTPEKPINNNNYARQNNATYNKGKHADVMHDLILMAFQCDATRVITYMMEDERSEFAYDHVTKRSFANGTSTEASGTCGEHHNSGQHGPDQEFASMTWWHALKLAELATRLDGVMEENGKTVLDNTLIMFGSCMHGSNHSCAEIPIVLLGSGGGTFKTDQHVELERRWLRDLHHTVMTDMYGMSGPDVDGFGAVRADVPRESIDEIVV